MLHTIELHQPRDDGPQSLRLRERGAGVYAGVPIGSVERELFPEDVAGSRLSLVGSSD